MTKLLLICGASAASLAEMNALLAQVSGLRPLGTNRDLLDLSPTDCRAALPAQGVAFAPLANVFTSTDGSARTLGLIAALRDQGVDLIIAQRSAASLPHAFGQYWNDIAHHHARFGRLWNVRTDADAGRLAQPYRRSLGEELVDPAHDWKFLPDMGGFAAQVAALLGAENLCLLRPNLPDMTQDLTSLSQRLLPAQGPIALSPLAGAEPLKAPLYLYGGITARRYALRAEQGVKDLEIPAGQCVLVTAQQSELLPAERFDLPAIVAAGARWSLRFETSELPPRVHDYLADQAQKLSTLAPECFLSGQAAGDIAQLVAVPPVMEIERICASYDLVQARIASGEPPAVRRDGKVTIGRGGRLFLHNDLNRVMDQHSGKLSLSGKDLERWCQLLERRTQSCKAQSLHYSLLFCPDNHAVYREDVPELDESTGEGRPVLQVLSAYQGKNILYPLAQMRAVRTQGETCHMTDSHWSGFGAYIAYQALMQSMGLDVPVLSDGQIRLRDHQHIGDLGGKVDPPLAGRTTDLVILEPMAQKTWSNGIVNRGHMSLWRNKRRDLPRVLLLSDSYGLRFQPCLAESFSDLFVLQTPQLDQAAIDHFRPDVVISVMAERFAYKVPQDEGEKTALEHAIEKQPSAGWPILSD